MKKLLFTVVVLFAISLSSQAQTAPAKKAAQPAPVKTATAPATGKPVSIAQPVKADGTPDMRYKANREADKKAPKLKKDGTPDMRYKRNKND